MIIWSQTSKIAPWDWSQRDIFYIWDQINWILSWVIIWSQTITSVVASIATVVVEATSVALVAAVVPAIASVPLEEGAGSQSSGGDGGLDDKSQRLGSRSVVPQGGGTVESSCGSVLQVASKEGFHHVHRELGGVSDAEVGCHAIHQAGVDQSVELEEEREV